MKYSFSLILFISFFFTHSLNSQMIDGSSVKYGNEWIDHEKTYYKIPVSEDGIYKINYQGLIAAGIDVNQLIGEDLQIFKFGQEVPLYTSTATNFVEGDYILFYGKKNRGEIDKYLYEEQEKQLNPEYSLFNDTLNYFLCINPGSSNARYSTVENDLSGNLPLVEEYYWHEEKIVNHSAHFKPTYDGTNKVTYSHLDVAEGYSSPMQDFNEYSLEVNNYINNGLDPYISFRLATSISPHKTEISLNGNILETLSANGYTVTDHTINIAADDITSQMTFGFEGVDVSTALIDRNSQPYLSLFYPRTLEFSGEQFIEFEVEASQSEKYFEIPDLNISPENALLLDLSNGFIMTPEIEDVKLKFLLPPSDIKRKLVVFDKGSVPQNTTLSAPLTFIDYSNYDEEFIIISNKQLFAEYNGVNQVQAYADYRSSLQGGNLKSIIVEVQEIYDQFGYGINRHSQSMNNFITYINSIWTAPKSIFIIGKGRDYIETRTFEQLIDPENLFYVPTYGYHGSDILLAASKPENSSVIPIGRIAVKNTQQIEEYLEKMKQHENYLKYGQSLEEKEWMKKVIHLSGGDSNIQDLLLNYLNEMAKVIENNSFGANVVTYGRSSGTATETVTDRIVEDINDGASIITFFGHSGVSGSDFNIGNLDNEKFPLFLSLGCYSGDIHTSITTGQSEKFVLSPTGVIAFLGSAGTAYITPQYVFGKDFYERIGDELYGKSVGEALKAVLDLTKTNQSLSIKSLNQQMTFHGDPSVRLNPHSGPDYICDFESTNTIPGVINSNDDEFLLNFDVVNLGKWVDDSLGIRVIRQFPYGEQDTSYLKIAAPKYREQVSMSMATGNSKGIGENCVYISLDYDQRFDELVAPEAENNNEMVDQNGMLGFCFHIVNNGAKPIYPAEFSIVNKEEVILKASTFNYFVGSQHFIFQIDTTELFNSPVFSEHKEQYEGGLLEWNPQLNFEEDIVYYWRISPDTLGTGLGYLWSNSSFIFLPESSEGWNQSHKYQYEKDDFQGLEIDGWNIEMEENQRIIRIRNKKYDPDDPNIGYIDENPFAAFNPVSKRPAFHIVAWGPEKIINNITGNDFGSISYNKKSFTFKTDNEENRRGIKDLLESMPDSAIICSYTVLDTNEDDLQTDEWAQDSINLGYNLFSIYEDYGATQIRELESKGAVPYIFVFKKGRGTIAEKIGNDIDDIIEVTYKTTVNLTEGSFFSTLIGPAKKWNSVLWNEQKFSPDDFSYIRISTIDENNNEEIIDTLNEVFELDISDISATQYPYLKLEYFAKDNADDRDCPNFNYWRVLYEGLPDAVLIMDEFSEFHKDTLNFGDNFRFKATAFNNSAIDMDSLEVIYSVKKANNDRYIFSKTYAPLLANDTLHIGFNLSTSEFAGLNEFTVELNPDHKPVEQFYFNNIGIKRFFVSSDKENPILDVTFDGVHIMDGDIVSPRPEIQMMLKDENTFLLLDDPGVFTKITLIDPNETSTDIPVESDLLEFIPAENTADNIARMIFKPELALEGQYSLYVQARDASNNIAGANEYQVDFTVILDEQISNVYNYPNPFSTSTQFVFTLTGYEVPDHLTIRIMTLSGKVVREITKDELGPLKIGNNLTEYRWDGKDQFGHKLGNGVYLYQVKATNFNGEDYELMDSGENDSRFFKKGWGKMAILR